LALGRTGAMWLAAGIAISALGFLSQSVLTAPRVYFAMARDGVFFRQVAWLSPATRVPVVAIALQGAWAMVIALSGRYEQILNYVVAMDELFIGLSATCLFIFRRRESKNRAAPEPRDLYRTPGHPYTTGAFVVACWLVVAATFYRYPHDSLIGLGITLAGLPVYYFWRGRDRAPQAVARHSSREV
jgi:basic amino acid/polyamine antiporter, APA family